MPDDPMYPAPPAAVPVPPPTAAPAEPPTDPAPGGNGAASITPEAIQAAVAEALSPLQTRLEQAEADNASLRQQLAGPADPNPNPLPAGDDFTDAFVKDPEGAVKNVATGVVKELAPYLNQLGGTAHLALLRGQEVDIDREFGEGTWAEEFLPILSKRLDTAREQNPTLLSSADWINSEVMGVKGFKMNQLVERRAALSAKATEAEKAETQRITEHIINTTGMTGGVAAPSDKPREPNQAEADYLAAREAAGSPRDLETIRRSAAAGSNVTSIRAAQPKPKEGGTQ